MKYTLILLALCLACICTHAQKIDKKLLYGRWDLYGVQSPEFILYRDSMAENIKVVMNFNYNALGVRYGDSLKDDSIKQVLSVKVFLDDYFKTYVAFDEKGNIKAMLGYKERKNGGFAEKAGTYEWSGENKVIWKIKDTSPEVTNIIELTPVKLVIELEDKSAKKNSELIFTRAK